MYIIKTMPHTRYNMWGNPVVQKLVWHDRWYVVVSTTWTRNGVESMAFLSDKFGKEAYMGEILTAYGMSYEESERKALEKLKSKVYNYNLGDDSIEAWANAKLRDLYEWGDGGERIGYFLRMVALSRTK